MHAHRDEKRLRMRPDKTGSVKSAVQRFFGRRLLVLCLTSVSALLGMARAVSAEPIRTSPALPVETDSDPSDGPGRGRGRPRESGLADSAPGDAGIGCQILARLG